MTAPGCGGRPGTLVLIQHLDLADSSKSKVKIPGMSLVARYETWLGEQGLSSNTINQRLQFVRARIAEWNDITAMSGDELAAWLRQYDGWTRRTYHSALLSFFTFAVDAGLVERNPVDRIKRTPTPDPQPHPLTDRERAVLLEHATGDMRLWLQLGLLAGLRLFEIAKLRGEECNERAFFFAGKGGQMCMVPMHPDLWALLQERPRAGWVFPSPVRPGEHITKRAIEKRVRLLCRSLGIEPGIHRTRATYATDLVRNGQNIRVVQRLLRHRSLSSTEHYVLAVEDELTRAIRGLAA